MTNYEHSFRRGPLGSERTYRLAADAIEWRTARRHGKIEYADIEAIWISSVRTIGVNDQLMDWRPRYVLRRRSGARLVIAPDHYVRIGQKENRQSTFYPFVQELAARITQANPDVRIEVLPARRRIESIVAAAAPRLLDIVRLFDFNRIGRLAAWVMRLVGPLLPEHRIGRANLAAAFPEKTPAEIERILAGVWDNLGRCSAEFASLDRILDHDPTARTGGRIIVDKATAGRISELRNNPRPALYFAAHLANWELPAVVATAAGLDFAAVYQRPPTVNALAKYAEGVRTRNMGSLIPGGFGAAARIANVLQKGGSVAMLVDQHFFGGIDVVFFGRKCKINPTLAWFARRFDCEIYGARIIRLPDQRFRYESTDVLRPPRDSDGKIDVAATMQMITSIIELWVREYPEQWLWLHRRWRS